MNWGNYSIGNSNRPSFPDLKKIFIHARNQNLLWRYEILAANGMDATELIEEMEDDIFWDLAEIDMEKSVTKSLRMTNLSLEILPANLSCPVNTQILDLSGNAIRFIPDSWFPHFSELRVLRIASNNFSSLPWESLSYLKSLRIIDLRKNPWTEEFISKFKSFVRVFGEGLIKIYW